MANDSGHSAEQAGKHGLASHFAEIAGVGQRSRGRRYSRFVTTMRMGLLFLAAGLIAVVVTVGIDLQKQEGFNLSFATIDAETSEPAMVRPQFTGMDQENRPFLITADKAVQDSKDPRIVNLHNLKASIAFGANEKLYITAPTGRFRQGQMQVRLNAPVSLKSSHGYVLDAGTVEIDLKNGTATSKEKLEGRGPLGYFKAGNMIARSRGERLYFAGGVKMIVKPKAARQK